MVALDVLLAADAFWLAGLLGAGLLDLAALAAVPVAIALVGGYPPAGPLFGGPVLAGRLLVAGMCCAWIASALEDDGGRGAATGEVVALSIALPAAWTLVRWGAHRRGRGRPERALIVGSGVVAQRVFTLCARHPEHNITVVGRVDDEPLSDDGVGAPLLGSFADIGELVAAHGVTQVIVAFSALSDEALMMILRSCDDLEVDVNVVPRLFDLVGTRPVTRTIGALPFLEVGRRQPTRSQRAAKRAFDIVMATVLLVLLSPVLLAIAVAVLVGSGRPLLFRQQRAGRGGTTFEMLKFRTMVDGPGPAGDLVKQMIDEGGLDGDAIDHLKRASHARVTRVGRILRRTSLDELPQLLNVLGGSMSLVGPRPLPLYEAEAVRDWQLVRQQVRPGITGLWQVLGRSEVPWEERLQLDYSYVRHWSIGLDLRILGKTIGAITRAKGAL